MSNRVVTCLLINCERKLLILKRSDKVRTYKGKWGGVAGYVEDNERPVDTAFKEIREETGFESQIISLLMEEEPIEFTDIYNDIKIDWIVYPFLFKIEKNGKVQIDWEHSEYRWIEPPQITKFDTVPHLKEIVFKMLG